MAFIHTSYVSKNNFISRKSSKNQKSTMVGSSSMSHEAEIKLNIPEPYVVAHIFTPFQVTVKKFKSNEIFGRDLLWEIGI